MIVDNDVTVQMDLEEYFEESHHHLVGIVETEKEAVTVARETSPDIVLIEIDLSGETNGIDIAETIQRQVDAGVVFMTVCGDFDVIRRAKRVSPLAYVLKPFDGKQILATVEIALNNQAINRKLKTTNRKLERRIAEQEAEMTSRKRENDQYAIIPGVNGSISNSARVSSIGLAKWRFTP